MIGRPYTRRVTLQNVQVFFNIYLHEVRESPGWNIHPLYTWTYTRLWLNMRMKKIYRNYQEFPELTDIEGVTLLQYLG